MGGSSTQRRTDPPMSSIHSFSIEEMYTPQFSDSVIFKNPIVKNLPLKQSRPHHRRRRSRLEHTKRGRFKTAMHPVRLRGHMRKKLCCVKVGLTFSKIACLFVQQRVWEARINLNTNVGDDDEDEVQEIRRPIGRDKARDAAKKKEYRQRHDDIRFYLQPCDHLTGDARLAMEELREEINAKYDLPY
nr:hypothetical protein [Tanacetum cinerariifolium]